MGLLNTQSLSDQVYEVLRKEIISQDILCGEKLNIRELQKRLSVSATPIREAISRLEQEGLIEHVSNVGARVILIEKRDVKEIVDLCEILDCGAVSLAMQSGETEALAEEIEMHIKGQEIGLEEEAKEKFMLHSDKCHEVFYKYAKNKRLDQLSRQIQGQMIILIAKHKMLQYPEKVVEDHRLICEAVKQNDEGKAVFYMKRHFENTREILLSVWKTSGGAS